MPTSARAADTDETRYPAANSMVPNGAMWASPPTKAGRRKSRAALFGRFRLEFLQCELGIAVIELLGRDFDEVKSIFVLPDDA